MSNRARETHRTLQNEIAPEQAAFEVLRESSEMVERKRVEMQYEPIMDYCGLSIIASSGSHDQGNLEVTLGLRRDATKQFSATAENYETALKSALGKAVSELNPAEMKRSRKAKAHEYEKRMRLAPRNAFTIQVEDIIEKLHHYPYQDNESVVTLNVAAIQYLKDNPIAVGRKLLEMRFQPTLDKYGLTLGIGLDHEGKPEVTLQAGHDDNKTFKAVAANHFDFMEAFDKAFTEAKHKLTFPEARRGLTPDEIKKIKRERMEIQEKKGGLNSFREKIENVIRRLHGGF